jgi:hypothetical protein
MTLGLVRTLANLLHLWHVTCPERFKRVVSRRVTGYGSA